MASKCTRQSPHLHLRSHILWWAALPRRRCSWYLDSKSFAIWQDLIKMILSIRVAVPTLPASAWATVLVGKLAEQVLGFPSSLGPGPIHLPRCQTADEEVLHLQQGWQCKLGLLLSCGWTGSADSTAPEGAASGKPRYLVGVLCASFKKNADGEGFFEQLSDFTMFWFLWTTLLSFQKILASNSL